MAYAQFLLKHKWTLILILVAIFLFYWYEIRPIWVYRNCTVQSSIDARKLLASKAEIAKGTSQGESYQRLMDRNMYLRSDYESFLQKCLIYYGMEMPTQLPEDPSAAEQPADTQ